MKQYGLQLSLDPQGCLNVNIVEKADGKWTEARNVIRAQAEIQGLKDDVHRLKAKLQIVQAQATQYKRGLRYYANTENWEYPYMMKKADGGEVARKYLRDE